MLDSGEVQYGDYVYAHSLLLDRAPGQHVQWYGSALIWKEHSFTASLAVCWEPGYEEVWIVISDLPVGEASYEILSGVHKAFSNRRFLQSFFGIARSFAQR